MRISISKSKNAEQIYIIKSFRDKNGKSTSTIYRKLGSMADLLPQFDNDREKVMKWAREKAKQCTEEEKSGILPVTLELSQSRLVGHDRRIFNAGYIFLQDTLYDLDISSMCRKISSKRSFDFPLADILSDLVCARILQPCSKRSSYEYASSLLEKPSYQLHDVYRSLDVLNDSMDMIQEHLYRKSSTLTERNSRILFYDCTNYYFEIEEEDDFRKYGKAKQHKPNPIVQMGLFMDGNGIPLAFSVFPGNESEQPSMAPLEKKIIRDFGLSKIVVCTDAGLASTANRRLNNIGDRSFIVTQSLKKLNNKLKDWALSPEGWHLSGSDSEVDISEINEEEALKSDLVYFKEKWIKENGLEQRLIVSYSVKYKNYQRSIRSRQVERAAKKAEKNASRTHSNPNSPDRFLKEINTTKAGEVAQEKTVVLDGDRIREEERYDGFYGVCTTLEDPVSDIIDISRRRWEIEESFRIMKTEFEARPVYLSREKRIKAHFLTCFIALLVYRILERKIDCRFSVGKIIEALASMKMMEVKGFGYLPSFNRTEVTDAIHESFGYRLDTEIISHKNMKKIIKSSKNR